jgi:integrase/recombinase XerD
MADITLNFVNSYRDSRNGTMRHVFRRKGYKKLLKGRPGSADFMNHYAELLAQSENAAAQIGASKIKPGSIDALVVRYLQHDFFTKGLAKSSQAARRPILDNFRQCKTPSGFRYGENRLATMHRKNISDALAGKTPIMQKGWIKALRHLIAFAIDQGELKTDPTIGMKTTRPPKTSGHVTWGDAQIEQYREQHAIGRWRGWHWN